MPGIFEEGVIPDDSPKSDSQGAEGQRSDGGESPEGNRLAELERKNAELQGHLSQSLADNAALKVQQGQQAPPASEPERKVFTKEELKEFGMRDDGKNQVDAAITYTDQVLEREFSSFEERFRKKMQKEQTDMAVQKAVAEILPELSDPKSEFMVRVTNEQQSIMVSTGMDQQRAYEVALLKVSRNSAPGAPPTGENPARYAARRRVEQSGAMVSSPGLNEPGQPSGELTSEQLELGRTQYRIKSIDDPDPARRAQARKFLKSLFDKRDEQVIRARPGGIRG